MPTSLPPSVRETWGEQAAEDFSDWIEEYVQDHAVARDEYREVLSRLDVIEEQLDHLDGRLDRMEERIENRFDKMEERFENRFDRFEQRLDEQSAQFNQRIDEQNAQFNQRTDAVHERLDTLHEQMRVMTRWTVGTIALFGTIVTVLLAIAEFGA